MCSVNANGVKNSPITRRDVLLANGMLDPRKFVIQGKIAQSKPDTVDVNLQKMDVLKSMMKFHKDLELAADTMHANDVPFLTTMHKNSNYGKISALKNLKYQ